MLKRDRERRAAVTPEPREPGFSNPWRGELLNLQIARGNNRGLNYESRLMLATMPYRVPNDDGLTRAWPPHCGAYAPE